jgi:hypothetical protein
MKAYKMNSPPIYTRAVVEQAEEMLPDPGDCPDMTIVRVVGSVSVGFVKIPTTTMSKTEGPTYWKWELHGRVEQ